MVSTETSAQKWHATDMADLQSTDREMDTLNPVYPLPPTQGVSKIMTFDKRNNERTFSYLAECNLGLIIKVSLTLLTLIHNSFFILSSIRWSPICNAL